MQRCTKPGDTITFDLASRDVPWEQWMKIGVSVKTMRKSIVAGYTISDQGVMSIRLKGDLDPQKIGPSVDLLLQHLETTSAFRAGHTRTRASVTNVIGVHGNR